MQCSAFEDVLGGMLPSVCCSCFSLFGSIERLPPLSGCPALLHLDLSFNCLSRTEDLQCFTPCPLLQRLHLNDNPLCFHPLYRALVVANSPCLVELDASPVSANEREAAVAALGGVSHRWAILSKAVNGGQSVGSVCPTAIANVAAGVLSFGLIRRVFVVILTISVICRFCAASQALGRSGSAVIHHQ